MIKWIGDHLYEMEVMMAAWDRATHKAGATVEADVKATALLEILCTSAEMSQVAMEFQSKYRRMEQDHAIDYDKKLNELEFLIRDRVVIKRQSHNSSKLRSDVKKGHDGIIPPGLPALQQPGTDGQQSQNSGVPPPPIHDAWASASLRGKGKGKGKGERWTRVLKKECKIPGIGEKELCASWLTANCFNTECPKFHPEIEKTRGVSQFPIRGRM